MAERRDDLDRIAAVTLGHYEAEAEAFREGTRDHDVRQNVAALLRLSRAGAMAAARRRRRLRRAGALLPARGPAARAAALAGERLAARRRPLRRGAQGALIRVMPPRVST